MKQTLTIIVFIILHFSMSAQSVISGKVTDMKGEPILGANIYLEGTYDGASSDENGEFKFMTSEKGVKKLLVSFISFESFSKIGDVSSFKNLHIKLKDDVNTLDAVTINAGTFEAGDNAKVTALKPLDVVTTS